jgi:hypothetical protein
VFIVVVVFDVCELLMGESRKELGFILRIWSRVVKPGDNTGHLWTFMVAGMVAFMVRSSVLVRTR